MTDLVSGGRAVDVGLRGLEMTLLAWAQFVALVLAGLFFAVKLSQGWFMVNISLSATIERRARQDGDDDLAVAVTITKGQVGSAQIHDTAVRVRWNDGSKVEKLIGTARLVTTRSKPYLLDTSWADQQDRGHYRLPPGEATVWSCHAVVPTGTVCVVEVVVVGLQWPNRYPGQWRCSLVSLPTDLSGQVSAPLAESPQAADESPRLDKHG